MWCSRPSVWCCSTLSHPCSFASWPSRPVSCPALSQGPQSAHPWPKPAPTSREARRSPQYPRRAQPQIVPRRAKYRGLAWPCFASQKGDTFANLANCARIVSKHDLQPSSGMILPPNTSSLSLRDFAFCPEQKTALQETLQRDIQEPWETEPLDECLACYKSAEGF